MRLEQEHAADDVVLASGVTPAAYAGEIVAFARCGNSVQLLAGAGSRSMLRARVKAILDTERSRTVVGRRIVLASLLAVVAVSLPMAAMQTKRKIYKVGEGVTSPQILHKEEPQYTEEARDAKIEGSVALSAIIESDGSVQEVAVLRGLDPGLDNNAMEAIRNWQFRPAEKDGAPVAVSVRIEVNFRLK
jgi:TonB family protein